MNGGKKGTPRKGTPRTSAPRTGASRPQGPASSGARGAMPRASRPQRAQRTPSAARPSTGRSSQVKPSQGKALRAPSPSRGRVPMKAPTAAPRPSSASGSARLGAPSKGSARQGAGTGLVRSAQPTPRNGSGTRRPGASRRLNASPSSRGAQQRPTSRPSQRTRPVAAAPKAKKPQRGFSLKSAGRAAAGVASAGTSAVGSIVSGVAGAAAPRPQSGKERRRQHQRQGQVRALGTVVGAIIALGLVALVAYFALRNSSSFSVDNVDVEPTLHVSESDVANLLRIEDGTTLLNVDTAQIESQLKKDPWVASVSVERQFPHTLKLTVNEQAVDALVVMNSGSMGWYLGSSGTWIQPVKIEAASGQSVNDAALALARSEGALLITGAPATVEPAAGSVATDDVLSAVKSFREGFSSSFLSQIVSFDATSADAISCVMESGVQVSLGSATNISYKEQVASALLQKYPGQLTYINVRVPSTASVRKIGSSDVTQGSGASASTSSDASGTSSDSSAGTSTSTDASTSADTSSSTDTATGTGSSSDAGNASSGGDSSSGNAASKSSGADATE